MFEVHSPSLQRVVDLNPVGYNPRRIDPSKFEALKESIKATGFLEALVVQKKGLKIIGGHQRLRAVKEICVEENRQAPDLPCIVLDLTDKAAKKLNVKLNKIRGDFEMKLLGELLVDIYDDDTKPLPVEEFALLGFEADEAQKYIRLVEPDRVPLPTGGGDDPTGFGKSITLSIEFDSVQLRDKVKTLLVENAKTTKQKTGTLVAERLGLSKAKAPKAAKKTAKKLAS